VTTMRTFHFAALLAASILASSPAGAAAPVPHPLRSDALCAKCTGYLLPGAPVPSPHATFRIDSDLPEIYTTNGVLYTTKAVLPPFRTKKGEEVPLAVRTQRNIGFDGVDDSFELFLYHFSQPLPANPTEVRRIVVLAENTGPAPARVVPRQVMVAGGTMGRVGSVESILGERVFLDRFDAPVEATTIQPGAAAIVAYTPQLGAAEDGPDRSKAKFVNGIVRAKVDAESLDPKGRSRLHLSVVSIPASDDKGSMLAQALALKDTGADSAEGYINLTTPPEFCAVRRVVGVAYNQLWQSDAVAIDAAQLPAEGIEFPMALPANQSVGCEDAQQTVNLLLHPGFTHPDSIGNYHMEYFVRLVLSNGGAAERKVDLRFGKKDAVVGLVWQVATGPAPLEYEAMATLPHRHNWAGKNAAGCQPPRFDASFLEGGPVAVPPGGQVAVSLRFLILGSSSLPFDLVVQPTN